MTREWVAVPETHTVQQALADLRARGELPPQTDRVFIVDARHVLRGAVPLHALLLRDPSSPLPASMRDDTIELRPAARRRARRPRRSSATTSSRRRSWTIEASWWAV